MTDETFECTDDLFLSNAGKIRQVFSVQSKSIEENAELIVNKSNRLSTVFQQINSNIISPSAVNSVAKAVTGNLETIILNANIMPNTVFLNKNPPNLLICKLKIYFHPSICP